jgi:threonine dehydrogenase-like Zn-dependent dehydrogenase
MQALVFDGVLRLDPDYPIPCRTPGESLIRVRLAGICGTDLEVMRGYKGYAGVLGHEFVGVVAESDDPALAGKRVCGEINLTCGVCPYCRQGMPTHCTRRAVVGILNHQGCFAEYLVLPNANLHVVPDEVPDEAAVLTEPLAAALHIGDDVPLDEIKSALILGDGPLGALCALSLAALGCKPIVVGKHQDKLAVLTRLGVIACSLGDGVPRDVDLVVDATGSPSGLRLALELVRPRGTLVLKSTVAGQAEYDLAAIAVKEIRIVGSRCGSFAPALRLLAEGAIDVRPLISLTLPLADGEEAMRRASDSDTMKVLVRPSHVALKGEANVPD